MASSSSSSSSSSTSMLPSEPLPWRPNTRPKLPPGALLDIADDLLWDLFTEWLPLESVCHLDSALCQKRRRPYFLALLATKVLLFNREEIRVLTDPTSQPADIDFTHRALGAAALNWVLKRGIHLASLHLPRYYGMEADEQQSIREAIASLALDGRLDKLETISLNYCHYIGDADLVAILSKCYRSVKSVDIRRCGLTESVAAAHIKRCTKLEVFTAKGNESAADMVEIVQTCRKLRKVDLSQFSDRLTDEVVLSVADNCHLLEHLNLENCDVVSDAAIRRVAESCPLLQFVELHNTNITDTTMVALCNRCRLLKRLFLADCGHLTDAAILAVAEKVPGLTHISLYSIEGITSTAVETLANKCRDIEVIDLNGITDISDATLSKIAEHCSKLRWLDVYDTAVTAVGLTEIATKCSELSTVYVERSKFASLKQMFPNIQWGIY